MRDVELIDEPKNSAAVLRQRPAGVLIATPSATHAEVAIPFIEAGVATFIEKPMATTVDDAIRIREAAVAADVPVVVGHVHLHNPAFVAAQDLLGNFGPIQTVLWEGMNHQPRTDSSVLWDWFPHALSMAQALFGATPSLVQARAAGTAPGFRAAIARFVICGVVEGQPVLLAQNRHAVTLLLGRPTSVRDERDTADHKSGDGRTKPRRCAGRPGLDET
ncbi:Gfo/Idh/MocA family protein, partial [Mycobacterium malmoense]|uniref:Gfo/Idh/MocA family protein n=1 Tax=Mycobacterium malmoense TaxID=1780 RepID=UPI00159EBD19